MPTQHRTVAILTVALWLISSLSCGPRTHPSDLALVTSFREHEPDFQRLVSMSNEDHHVVRIAGDFNWLDDDHSFPRTRPERGLSNERWDAYRSIFQELGLKCGLTR